MSEHPTDPEGLKPDLRKMLEDLTDHLLEVSQNVVKLMDQVEILTTKLQAHQNSEDERFAALENRLRPLNGAGLE